ncbi:MAG: hypothetical protein HOU81_15090 [Hamadaea sp.]|uniref:hypothetical protein n=1 Tax=Hamadaea sp. TaxID=2024425 RepID=UPI0017FE6E89|nr:hypothetical protein [Hamadaea sp.]NUR72139.1 hypothetical protein [Hamadaea sp.]NUT21334.1 hypothetical protein [Hamadaea sp.]
MAAPWQVNWQAYDVPRIAEAVQPDPHERDIIPAATAVGDLLAHAADLLLRAVGKLEKSWSDKSDAAAETYAIARALAASLKGDSETYHQLAADVGRVVDQIDLARRDVEPVLQDWLLLGQSATATTTSLTTAAQELNRRARGAMGRMDKAVSQMQVNRPTAYSPKILPVSVESDHGRKDDRPRREPRTDPEGSRHVPLPRAVIVAAGAVLAPAVGWAPTPGLPGVSTTVSSSAYSPSAASSGGNRSAAEVLNERASAHVYDHAYASADDSSSGGYDGPGPTLTGGGGPPMTPMTPGAPVSMMPLGMNSGMAPGGGALVLPGPGVGGGGVLRKATMSWSATPAPQTGTVIDGTRGGQLADWAAGLPKPTAQPVGTPTWQVARGGPGVIGPGSVLGPGARQAEDERSLKKWYAELATPWRESGPS